MIYAVNLSSARDGTTKGEDSTVKPGYNDAHYPTNYIVIGQVSL